MFGYICIILSEFQSDIHHSSVLTAPANKQHQHKVSPPYTIILTAMFTFYQHLNFYIILNLTLFIAEWLCKHTTDKNCIVKIR